MNGQAYKLLLYVVTNDGDDWETPNALVVPVNNHDSKINLGYIKRIFPLPGNYHFRTRYKHGNSHVWLDLTKDDEIIHSVDNILYMKILRLNNELKNDNFLKTTNLLSESKPKEDILVRLHQLHLFLSLNKANTAKIAQYVDKVIHLGKRNLLFRVDITHLYSIWNLCKTEQDYRYALTAVNHFYNFGRQLTPEAVDKLFVTTLRCNMTQQAIELIRGSCNWLKRPPSLSLIYVLLTELISKNDFNSVYEVYKIVRTSWQIPLNSSLYEYCINYMLTTGDHALDESLMVYGDSDVMGVRLSEEIHTKMLEKCLELSEDNNELCRATCVYIINRMIKELGKFSSPKTYYLLSWFSFRFKEEMEELVLNGLQYLLKDWKRCLDHSLDSNIFFNEKVILRKNFIDQLDSHLESFKLIND